MQSLWLLTKKNLKVLLRAKGSALIVVFAPLLIILILGLSYNNTAQYGLNIGVHATSFTEDVNSFIELLQEKEFTITKYDSIESCITEIKMGNVHTCVDLPTNLQGGSTAQVEFHVDPTRINLVWMIQETVAGKFNLRSQELSLQRTQDVLQTFDETATALDERKSSLELIRQTSSEAASSASVAASSLSGIDTSPPQSTYNLAELTSLTNLISGAKGSLKDAQEEWEEINETNNIGPLLDDAVKDLDDLSAKLAGNGTIMQAFNVLESDLVTAKNKLSQVAAALESSTINLDSASSDMQNTLNQIDQLQASLTDLQSDLKSKSTQDVSAVAKPIEIKVSKISESGSYLNILFPALLIMVIMFSSLLLGTALVAMEKNSIASVRNYFVPVRKAAFIAATYVTNLVLTLAEIIIILGVALFFLPNSWNLFPAVALILFVGASVFTFLGMTLGYMFKSEETGVLASISLGSLLLFLSGVVLPLEGIAPGLREIAKFNPFVIAEKLVREVFLFNSTMQQIWVDVLLLASYAIILFLVILIIEVTFHKTRVKHSAKK